MQLIAYRNIRVLARLHATHLERRGMRLLPRATKEGGYLPTLAKLVSQVSVTEHCDGEIYPFCDDVLAVQMVPLKT